jgi:hypothetical protein
MSQNLIDSANRRTAKEASGLDLRSIAARLSTGERVIGAASATLLVAMFLDWISVSCSGPLCGLGSSGGDGLRGWGWLTLLAVMAVSALMAARTVLAGRVTLPELPATDAVLYMAAGAAEVAGCLFFWLEYHGAFVSAGPISIGLGLGWPVALAAGAATVVGGSLMRTGEAR